MKIISVIFLFVLGCGNNSGSDTYNSEPASIEAANETDMDFKSSEEAPMVNQNTLPSPPPEQKIIKTARLSFETNDLSKTYQNIINATKTHGAVIQDDNSGKDYNRLYRYLTIRVPTTNFQDFIQEISKGVDYFDQKQISQQDVSEEFVDLEARLKAKRELESRYLELLKQAKTVEDMLSIERELSKIREEIEAKQGRLQFLQNRVSQSTITLEFYKTTAETGVTQSYGQKIKNALQGGWNGISVFLIGIIYLWPFFLLVLIAFIVIRMYLRKRKK